MLTSVYSNMIVVIHKSWSVRHRGVTVPVILREIIHHIEAYRVVHAQINRKPNPEVDKIRNHWGEFRLSVSFIRANFFFYFVVIAKQE